MSHESSETLCHGSVTQPLLPAAVKQVNGEDVLQNAISCPSNAAALQFQTSAEPESHGPAAKSPVIDVDKDLSALISKQMHETPDAIALEDSTTILTYAELNQKVGILAERLRGHGVSRDSLCGVLMSRSADYVIACVAALRAGGGFLVLESAYPASLLADVLADAKPEVVVTHSAYSGLIKADIPLIILDEPEPVVRVNIDEASPLPSENDLERLAFVSYSSGTTGRPKGIANPHRSPVLSYDLRFRLSDLGPGDRVACNVFFVWEILRPLIRGATVVAVPDESSYDPVALVDFLSSKGITETLMTPTLLAAVLSSRQSHIKDFLPGLHTLWLNGEVVTTDLALRAIKALPNTRLLNCYSASETHEIAAGDIRDMIDSEVSFCPVGPCMDPDHTYILNKSGQRVGTNISGELFVGGSLLARGYLNLPESTAKSFLPDPFDSTPGARMYRTGDLARMLPSGSLEITGRVGAMIKIRGYSVVPGKIASAIVEKLSVRSCAVVAHGDGLDKKLVAYVVLDEEARDRTVLMIDESGYSPIARQTLSTCLAHYMIPTLYVELEALAIDEVSGKVDLKSLPPPKTPTFYKGRKTGNDNEIDIETVAEIWAESLNTSPSAIPREHRCSFLDLGGHSLTFADLANRFSNRYGFPVGIADLVVNPTLAGHLETLRSARDGHTTAIQEDLPAFLRIDSALPQDIRPSGVRMCTLREAGTVMLTGATGFLGPFLLNDLLEYTSAKIICLVRFNNPSEDDRPAAISRLRKNLLDLGLWKDSILDRIEVLPGNLSLERLGLSLESFEGLASRIDVIIHAAATVNLVYPYAALRAANVLGTNEILRLASSQSGSTLHYISTNGVLPPPIGNNGWPEDAMLDVVDVPEKLLDGYGQTKWVAEMLIKEAASRGLPVRIIRPGTISGHSKSGSTNTYDLLTALIVESLHLGHAPAIQDWRAEMTPVDFISQAIIKICDYIDTDQLVFHIGDPNPVETLQIFSDLTKLGYPTEQLEWHKWLGLWKEKRGSGKGGDGAFTVDILRGSMPTVNFLQCVTVLNDSSTKPALKGIQRPKIDIHLLEIYARHWYGRGWLPKPPSKLCNKSIDVIDKGPLSGLVAVITGASSGIGAAVATALAREGAHVALAARRLDSLENVKRKLITCGGKILIRQTDVTNGAQVESFMRATNDELGPIDILVSCAGVMYYTLMKNVQTKEWDRTVDVNCKGLLHCLSSVVPDMLSRGSGHIVAISSDAGRKVFPGLGVYSASKFFVEACLQSLRLETAGSGLRVTSVQPGNTATELLATSTDVEAINKYGEPTGAKVLDPEDVAAAIVYVLRQPSHVAVNEILIEPRDEPI